MSDLVKAAQAVLDSGCFCSDCGGDKREANLRAALASHAEPDTAYADSPLYQAMLGLYEQSQRDLAEARASHAEREAAVEELVKAAERLTRSEEKHVVGPCELTGTMEEPALAVHLARFHSDTCAECHELWPCRTRSLADRLAALADQGGKSNE